MNTNTALMLGAGVVGVYLIANSGTSPVAQAANSLLSPIIPTGNNSNSSYPYLLAGAPAIPSAYSAPYAQQYIVPAMIAVNPNVGNSNYTLTQADANTYMANYTDVAQWANNTGPSGGARHQSPYQACVYHWKTYGVPQQRTFMPLPWNDPASWVMPVQNPKSSGGGTVGSVLGTVASIGLALLGVENTQPLLNDAEVQTVICGAAIAKDLLPMFQNANPQLVTKINNRINSVISQYN